MVTRSGINTSAVISFTLILGHFPQLYGQMEKLLIEKAVQQWAPLIWLSPGERYFPLEVEEFLDFVYPADSEGRAVAETLPLGRSSQSLYLVTKKNLETLQNRTSFLHGKNPKKHSVPVYVTVTECNNNADTPKTTQKNNLANDGSSFHVTYWTFYPYNEGKDICLLGRIPTPFIFDRCIGNIKTFGNHVADYEHMTITFTNNFFPSQIFLSVHDIGVYYKYEPTLKVFMYDRHKPGKGIMRHVKFPPVLRTFENRPLLYSAKGSHGLWSAPGDFQYVTVPKLRDKTGHGTPWQTWKNLKIYHLGYSKPPVWVKYLGRWGNPKNNCLLSKRLGICELSDAPFGILNRPPDFQC